MGMKVLLDETERVVNFYPDHSSLAHNIFTAIGGSKTLVRVYAATLVLFVCALVWTLFWTALYTMSGTMTYARLYGALIVLAGGLVVGAVLWQVGRATWGHHQRALATKMLVSCLTVVAALSLALLVATEQLRLGPTYCSRYVEALDEAPPPNRLGEQHCMTHSSQPFNKSLMTTCAHYFVQTGSESYQAQPPICRPGTQPAARAD